MEQLLTARQIQEALKVDRTTIYRMLKDGRLSGNKVGNRWRFSANDVDKLLSDGSTSHEEKVLDASEVFPWQCVQGAQDVFAEVVEIGSVITDCRGIPLTRMSNCCQFCKLIQASASGKKACVKSWQRLANQSHDDPEFTTCHAGLLYARSSINVSGKTIAFLVGGQFYSRAPHNADTKKQVKMLAHKYGIDVQQLLKSTESIRVLDERMVSQITRWLTKVAGTFEQISSERADLLSRLQHISEMSHFEAQYVGLDEPQGKSEILGTYR